MADACACAHDATSGQRLADLGILGRDRGRKRGPHAAARGIAFPRNRTRSVRALLEHLSLGGGIRPLSAGSWNASAGAGRGGLWLQPAGCFFDPAGFRGLRLLRSDSQQHKYRCYTPLARRPSAEAAEVLGISSTTYTPGLECIRADRVRFAAASQRVRSTVHVCNRVSEHSRVTAALGGRVRVAIVASGVPPSRRPHGIAEAGGDPERSFPGPALWEVVVVQDREMMF
jgi:hypothetical protein